jgi:WD40 repeat protein
VEALAVAPDGSWLACADKDGAVHIWDMATGQERATWISHHGGVTALAAAPQGRWLFSGGRNDGSVRIWDLATGRAQAAWTGHYGMMAVAVAPDGSWLASGGADREVRIWDPATGQVQALMRVDGSITKFAWVGTRALAVGEPSGLYVFELLKDATPAAAK